MQKCSFYKLDAPSNLRALEAINGPFRISYENQYICGGIDHAPFIQEIIKHNGPVKKTLEMCSGPAVIGFTVLNQGLTKYLDCADINPVVQRCIAETKTWNKISKKQVRFIHSDGFNNVRNKYDLIIATPPWFGSIPPPSAVNNKPRPHLWLDENWKLHNHFFAKASLYLNPGAMVIFSGVKEAAPPEKWITLAVQNNLLWQETYEIKNDATNGFFLVFRKFQKPDGLQKYSEALCRKLFSKTYRGRLYLIGGAFKPWINKKLKINDLDLGFPNVIERKKCIEWLVQKGATCTKKDYPHNWKFRWKGHTVETILHPIGNNIQAWLQEKNDINVTGVAAIYDHGKVTAIATKDAEEGIHLKTVDLSKKFAQSLANGNKNYKILASHSRVLSTAKELEFEASIPAMQLLQKTYRNYSWAGRWKCRRYFKSYKEKSARNQKTPKCTLHFEKTPFLTTSNIGATSNRLNWRAEMLLSRNKMAIKGQRILDLGSHDGRFAYACLQLNAKSVLGIEKDRTLVAKAVSNLKRYGHKPPKVKFVNKDFLDALRYIKPRSIDTVLCLGVLYHTKQQAKLIERIKNIRPAHLILDTAIETRETAQETEKNQVWIPKKDYVEHLLKKNDFEYRELNWNNQKIADWSHLNEFQEGRRVSYIARTKKNG